MKRFVFQTLLFFGQVTLPIAMFVIGVTATLLSYEVSPPKITLCQLARNPNWYDGRNIQIEASGYSSYGIFIIEDVSCNSPESWASVSLVESYEPPAEERKLFTESDSEFYRARILVTGRFDAEATMGCFRPKFGIDATDVKLNSSIKIEPSRKRKE